MSAVANFRIFDRATVGVSERSRRPFPRRSMLFKDPSCRSRRSVADANANDTFMASVDSMLMMVFNYRTRTPDYGERHVMGIFFLRS